MTRPVVVIGGGIVGTAIAYRLQIAKMDTILVERDIDPQGASAFSFASLSAFDEPQRAAYLLKTHGLVAWRRWAAEFGAELGVSFPGELRWAESEKASGHLTSLVERARRRGYPVRYVSSDEVRRREPASAPLEPLVASFAEDDGQADPTQAIDILRGAFAASGGTTLVARASITVEDQGISVRAGEDRIGASTVVVAAGAETSSLLERLGWDVPMEASPGLLAVTSPVEAFLNGTVYVYPQDGIPVHLRQLRDGRVVIGERAQDEVAGTPTAAHARSLLDHARRSFPILASAELDRFTVEWRPMPRDGLPIIGPLPGLDSLYVATGHSGVTIAPAVAEFVTQEIVESREAKRLQPLRPERFSLRQAEVQRTIEEAFRPGAELFLG